MTFFVDDYQTINYGFFNFNSFKNKAYTGRDFLRLVSLEFNRVADEIKFYICELVGILNQLLMFLQFHL